MHLGSSIRNERRCKTYLCNLIRSLLWDAWNLEHQGIEAFCISKALLSIAPTTWGMVAFPNFDMHHSIAGLKYLMVDSDPWVSPTNIRFWNLFDCMATEWHWGPNAFWERSLPLHLREFERQVFDKALVSWNEMTRSENKTCFRKWALQYETQLILQISHWTETATETAFLDVSVSWTLNAQARDAGKVVETAAGPRAMAECLWIDKCLGGNGSQNGGYTMIYHHCMAMK